MLFTCTLGQKFQRTMYYASDDTCHSVEVYKLGPMQLAAWCKSPSVNIGRVEDVLILRKLSSMTEEEKGEYKSYQMLRTDGVHRVGIYVDTPESFAWLLKKGFDIYLLINHEQAIELKPSSSESEKTETF